MFEEAQKKAEQNSFAASVDPEAKSAAVPASVETAQAAPKNKPASDPPALPWRQLKDDYPPGKYQVSPPIIAYQVDPVGAAIQRGKTVLERVKSKNHTSLQIAKEDSQIYWFSWLDVVSPNLQSHPDSSVFNSVCANYSSQINAALQEVDNRVFRLYATT